MEDSNARITVFAPVNDVFLYNPDLRAMDQKETLSHIGKILLGLHVRKITLSVRTLVAYWSRFSGHAGGRDQRGPQVGEADVDPQHHQQRLRLHNSVREQPRELCKAFA